MYKCELCKKEFSSITSLVAHLTHRRSKCKTNIKEYYNKFYRKEKEGYCKFCGEETSFVSLVEGYARDTCKHCRNKNTKTQDLRKETFKKNKEKRKKESGYYDLPEFCEICKIEDKNIRFKTRAGLSRHVLHIHNTQPKEYYDKYLKKPEEGICPVTGKETKFKNLREGYFTYNGKGNCSADLKIQNKKEETLLKNYGVKNAGQANEEVRIKNYRETVRKRKELQEERNKLIFLLRKLSIDKTNKLQCQICGRIYSAFHNISIHILKNHNVPIKDYYDKFWKKDPNEGICPISKLSTTFDCLERGYLKYHKSIVQLTPEVLTGTKKTQLKYIRKKIRKTQKMLNVEFLEINKLNYISDMTKIRCCKCGNVYENRFTNLIAGYGKCSNCFRKFNHVSINEKEIFNFLKEELPEEKIISSYLDLINNPETERRLEVDIYIPEKKLAIEYNGLYWHSDAVQTNADKIHILKTSECKRLGIQLIHIFEDEWTYKKDIVKSVLRHKLGIISKNRIFARKCIIKEVDSYEKNLFLDQNHLQGKTPSKVNLGAYFNNKLIAVMTFGHGNITRGGNPNDKDVWELSRFCVKQNIQVTGIASKLLSYFKLNYNWSHIFSYSDLRWSIGNLYEVLGFEKVSQSFPNYFYTKNDKRYHRYIFRKRPDEPKNIPEWQLRLNDGYYRIWDCGHLKFVLENDKN